MTQFLSNVTDSDFEALLQSADRPVLVEFHIPNCAYCRALEPLLEDAADAYGDRVQIVRMDAQANSTRPQYGLNGTPTLVLYSNGEERVTKTGAMRKQQLRAFLNAYV